MTDKIKAVIEAARIAQQSALMVLCVARNEPWTGAMLKDFDFAIEANRNLLDALAALDQSKDEVCGDCGGSGELTAWLDHCPTCHGTGKAGNGSRNE